MEPPSNPNGTETDSLVLPFVGQTETLSQIRAFIRSALSSETIGALWLQGETGIGKSRLISTIVDEFDPSVIVVRIRFSPDSPPILHDALHAALSEAKDRYTLEIDLSTEAGSSRQGLLGDLRGLIRRYPTIIVAEDLHLLDEPAARDLSTLLHSLEREPTGLIATTRPTDSVVYGLLLPFIVGTIEIPPLTRDDVAELARKLGHDPDRRTNIIDLVYRRTGGIPLVLWSVFLRVESRRELFLRSPLAQIRRIADEVSNSLMADVTGGLGDEDLAAARRLALLGEQFSERAASVVLDNAATVIRRLRDSRLLVPSLAAPPLLGDARSGSSPVYRFSHSLIHERLQREGGEPDERFVELILSGAPIYATLPIERTLALPITPECPKTIVPVLDHLATVIERLGSTPRWSVATGLLEQAEGLRVRSEGLLETGDRNRLELDYLLLRCRLYHGHSTRPIFREAIGRLLELTTSPTTIEEARRRLQALLYSVLAEGPEAFGDRIPEIFMERQAILERFPALLLDGTHLDLLDEIGSTLRLLPAGSTILIRFSRLLDLLLEAADVGGNSAATVRLLQSVAPYLLPVFSTPSELADRQSLADRIMASFGESRPHDTMLTTWPRFLSMIGRLEEARSFIDRFALPKLAGFDLGLQVSLRLQRLGTLAGLGASPQEIVADAERLVSEFEAIRPPSAGGEPSYFRLSVARHLISIAISTGRIDELLGEVGRICPGWEASLADYMQFARAALLGDRDELVRAAAADDSGLAGRFDRTVAWLLDVDGEGSAEAVEQIDELLRRPIVQRQDLLTIRIGIALLEFLASDRSDFDPMTVESIRFGLEAAILWVSERKIPGYADPVIQVARHYLDVGTIERYLRRDDDSSGQQSANEDANDRDLWSEETWNSYRLKIRVMGATTLQVGEEKQKKIRGARQRRFVTLLAAQELFPEQIDVLPFRAWATELDDPVEGANYLRILVSRLRKSIGSEMILTDGEHPPRLNPELVAVDVIRAADLLQGAEERTTIRNGAAATRLFDRAIDLLVVGRPFDEFDDPLFDAAREELRDRIRRTANALSALLRREGATAEAERVAGAVQRVREA